MTNTTVDTNKRLKKKGDKGMGYIYVRVHPWYASHNACKMGKTSNIYRRDRQYATYEIGRGQFKLVFEISLNSMGVVDKALKEEFAKFNIVNSAGAEFYEINIMALIEPYLIKHEIAYRVLSDVEISGLTVKPKELKKKNIQ